MAAKVLFLGHLAPNPLWFNPELPSCHSKWLPNYFGLPTWLQTLSGSIQSCQVVKMAAKVLLLGHLAPNPLWFSPELPSCHPKWLPKYFPWPLGSKPSLVQSRAAKLPLKMATKIFFLGHLAPNPGTQVQSRPDNHSIKMAAILLE